MSASPSTYRDLQQAGDYVSPNKSVSTYQTTSGILTLPLAEVSDSGAPVEFVRVHQPYRRRIYEFEATKQKTPPFIPEPADNTKEYLLASIMNFPLPAIGQDRSTLIWSSSGKMEFVEKGSWTQATGWRIGQHPILDTPQYIKSAFVAAFGGVVSPLLDPDTFGEAVANSLQGFPNDPSYANVSYDFAPHFPSRFMVSDLSLGN